MVDPLPEPPDSPDPESAPTGFAKVSQTLKRRTTDLLAVAILATGCLTVGAKVGRWWKQSPDDLIGPANAASRISPWGVEGNSVSFEVGNLHYAIHRKVITGDAASALDQLEQIAIAQLPNASLSHSPPTPAEQQLLAELQSVPVSQTLSSGASLYRIGPDLPMVILTKPASHGSASGKLETERVVCWGRAFPQSTNQWLVFLFHAVEEASPNASDQNTIPLPAESQRIQSIRDAGGQSWAGFRGPGPIEEWRRHFDDWFADHDWKPIGRWSKTETAWTATFQSSTPEQRAEVWLNRKADGTWEGMVYTDLISAGNPKK